MSEDDNRTSVLGRAATILEVMASAGPEGVRLLDLAERTEISRPTVHRILGALKEIGYVHQKGDKRYALGVRLGVLGLAAPSPLQKRSELQAVAQGLADDLGDTVYVSMRYFDGVYYLARAHGGFPVRMQTVEVGDILPMTATYSGIALMSQLDPERQHGMIESLSNSEKLEWSDIDASQRKRLLRQAIAQFDANGFLYGDDFVVPGLAGVSTLIAQKDGPLRIALSVSAIHSRLPEARIDSVVRSMKVAGGRIKAILESAGTPA